MDWSVSALGDPDTWPAPLRHIVQMMLAQRHAICLFWGPDLSILYNDAYAPILGAKAATALGRPFRVVWSDVWEDVLPFVDQALSGQGTWSEEMPLVMNRNGYDEETFWTFSYSPLFDDAGKISGLINVALDATPTVRSRREQEVLQRELVHRVKNTMAVVSAVVSSSLRHAPSLEDAREKVSDRIAALGKAQELMTGQRDDAHVQEIVLNGISAHLDRTDRITLDGPPIVLPAQQAVGLSLAVYELATNAAKYGALSGEAGHVDISWTLEPGGSFRFTWQERDGPPVAAPARTGFGSRLTNKIVAAYFSGTGETFYDAAGLRFELTGQIAAP
jgi:two-component sensor histidine kinase